MERVAWVGNVGTTTICTASRIRRKGKVLTDSAMQGCARAFSPPEAMQPEKERGPSSVAQKRAAVFTRPFAHLLF
eukprot:4234-Amphidinium_carterae.1